MTMTVFRRACVLAVLAVMFGSGAAAAQTVIVMNAPPGATVELALNAQTVATATTDAMGDATLKASGGQPGDTDARLFVEVCGDVRRVRLQAPAVPLPAQGACTRQDVGSLFSVQAITTFVVDLGASTPLVRVRQGPAPATWLVRTAPGAPLPERLWEVPGPALVLSGGGGLLNGLKLIEPQCGDVAGCTMGRFKPVYAGGATVWLTRHIGVQGSYARSTDIVAEGSGTGFRFTSATRLEMLNVAAAIGVPVKVARLYGIGGMTRHRATTTASETVDAAGTQAFGQKTEGWGLLYGGGLEVWATSRVGFYAEVTRARLKGPDVNGGEAQLDIPAPVGVIGLRISVLR
jgi:hypothetical protein